MKNIHFCAVVGLLIVMGSFGGAQTPAKNGEHADSAKARWYDVDLVRDFSVRTYYMNSNYPSQKYLLINSDGDFLNKRTTPFFALDGGGNVFSNFSFYYKLQGSGTNAISLRRASAKFATHSISLELARGSVWMGHGYHGSMLLSNNAEPFTLVKFQTEKPFHIPYIGDFSYMIFHGWPKDFKILGHRFSYMPVPWLELGGNQTSVYLQDIKFWEFPKVLGASEENIPGKNNTDQRASMDIAVRLSFLKQLFPPFIDGKVYFEYAGEDLFAWWQKEDARWFGPLGFEFLDVGQLYGIWLATPTDEIRIEYAQNYRNNTLLHKLNVYGYEDYSREWYNINNIPFTNGGAVMGHHMGSEADDIYIEFQHHWEASNLKLFYHAERHGIVATDPWPPHEREYPEKLFQYGIEVSKVWKDLSVEALFLWNQYKNIDINPDAIFIDPSSHYDANSYVVGLTFKYRLGSK